MRPCSRSIRAGTAATTPSPHLDHAAPDRRRRGKPRAHVRHGHPWEGMTDPDGSIALSYGADYYREGMSYTDAEDRHARVECFQAAEILYLHAAAKGNVDAYVDLGYIYSYDRCEGHYFVDHRETENVEDYTRPYPREQRAFECFSYAAEHGDAEACYKLGDLCKRGVGCEADPEKAFAWYTRAFELKDGMPPHVWGSIALRWPTHTRTASAARSTPKRRWSGTRRRKPGLDIGVRSSAHFYTKTLANTRAAIKRLTQELDGRY